MKKVIMLLVDSLMPNILEDAIRHKTVLAKLRYGVSYDDGFGGQLATDG